MCILRLLCQLSQISKSKQWIHYFVPDAMEEQWFFLSKGSGFNNLGEFEILVKMLVICS